MKQSCILFLLFVVTSTVAQKNQNEELAKIASGSYSVHKTIEKGYNKFVFETAKKKWPVELMKEADIFPKILIKRVGIIDELYSADLPDYPAYYYGGNAEIVITVLNKKIYYYSWTESKGAEIKYILSENSPGKYDSEKSDLDAYRRSMKNLQTDSREERKQENAEAAALEAAQNSLKGKEIKKISLKLVDAPAEIGMLTIVSIGIEVELSDGTMLKTKNLGGKTPYTDFETKVKGGDFAGGDFKVANDSREIPNDKIEIEIWSKYNEKIKGSFTHPINYKNDIFYQYQGRSGSNGRGGVVGYSENGGNGTDAKNVNVQVQQQIINGETVSKLTITDAYSGELYAEAKVHNDNTVTINVNGGNGGSGCDGRHASSGDGGDGGDGGNAGDVSVTGDASSLNIKVLSKGGRGGSGGAPKNSNYNSRGSNGENGIDGTVIK